ncbi:uncharacterized protein LOC112563178 isoform X2 [Pomacea canaliculata]|nr:uncharacterized protein LOC112563178 isoform X2 [Pomacea canaliculata]XP_025092739.1 uncharacterized protein LOC112563178 isoform X2 [Pomacea canaliculata]XP_025092740.1 uncharacterized protein LOC112563178 isoform X2 [Pomacea canaliculata]
MAATCVALCTAVAMIASAAASQGCLTGDACSNSVNKETIGGVTYCCSDVTGSPKVKVDGTCECQPEDEEMKMWADTTMNDGRMCLNGDEDCGGASRTYTRKDTFCCPRGHSLHIASNPYDPTDYHGCECRKKSSKRGHNSSSHSCTYGTESCRDMTNSLMKSRPYCCSNSISMNVASFGEVIYRGCRCPGNTAPVIPPGAYTPPLTGDYNSSGEACLYNALCDDSPSLKCGSRRDNVFCCYNSRGIHTKYLDPPVVTACTCTNDFWGGRCGLYQEPAPFTEQRCLTDGDCPVGINTTVVTTTNNVKVTYCCPSLIHKPHVQTVQGATPKDVCSCSSHGEDRGSPEEKVREWAELTKDYGQWCESGPVCGSLSSRLKLYLRVKYFLTATLTMCCRQTNGTQYYAVYSLDSDYDHVGCRCANTSVPRPVPGAYVVPEAGYFNSTGESCSYNSGCDNYPSAICESSEVAVCCYGSRGIVTRELPDGRTGCTCTNEKNEEVCGGLVSKGLTSRSSGVTPTHLCLTVGLMVNLLTFQTR